MGSPGVSLHSPKKGKPVSIIIETRIELKPWSKINKKDARPIYDYTLKFAQEVGLDPDAVAKITDEKSLTEALRLKIDHDESAPLRKYMTWNTEKGMAKLHRHEIRNILGQLEIVSLEDNGAEIRIRALKHVEYVIRGCDEKETPIDTYVGLPTLSDHEELLDQVIMDLRDRMEFLEREVTKFDKKGVFGRVAIAIRETLNDIDEGIAKVLVVIEEAVLKANSEVKKSTYGLKVCVLLLMATLLGTDVRRLAKYTGYNTAFVEKIKGRFMKAKIWGKKAPCQGHAWKIKQLCLDGFWLDVETAFYKD